MTKLNRGGALQREIEAELDHQKQRLWDAGAETLRWVKEDFGPLAPNELAEKHPWVLAALSAATAALLAGALGYFAGRNSRGNAHENE